MSLRIIEYHISCVCAKLSRRNARVIYKFRHYLPLKQLAQIYCSLIYPYMSYAIVAWAATARQIYIKYKLGKIMLLG